MPKKLFKYKLLLDENIPRRAKFPSLNRKFNIRHISADFKIIGLGDPEVYEFARKTNRLIVTYNIKDFEKFAELSLESGIIGISATLSNEQIDKKLTSLLTKSKKSELFGKFNHISGETEVK